MAEGKEKRIILPEKKKLAFSLMFPYIDIVKLSLTNPKTILPFCLAL